MMYATQRCPSIPLCDHGACSTPWPSLPHRACHLKQATAIGTTFRRSKSTRERPRDRKQESFSAVALPPHAASRRHFSQSTISSSSCKNQLSCIEPDGRQPQAKRDDSIPADRQGGALSRLREAQLDTSINANYDKDEREHLRECDMKLERYMEDEMAIKSHLSRRNMPVRYHVPCTSTINDTSSPSIRASMRHAKAMSMPPAPPDAFVPRTSNCEYDLAARTRSLCMLQSGDLPTRPQDISTVLQPDTDAICSNGDPPLSATPKLQPSPTFTRTRTIKFGLQPEKIHRSPTHTGASPPLRLFPITHPTSPTGSMDSSRTTSTHGGTTIASSNHINMFNNCLQQNSVFEDDDDEKKGLMEYLKRSKKGERTNSDRKRWSKWRCVFCCFSHPEG